MNGGFNGNDITQTEPFNNRVMGNSVTQKTNYAFNSVRVAIDTCADPELVDMNILSAPGISVDGLTNRVIDVCEARGDALGIIDIKTSSFTPAPDRTSVVRDDASTVRGNAADAAKSFKTRQINNSYGATYYPWTRVRDEETGKTFYCPPSVAAIGTLSYSQAVSEVWFAPAGFNRGGLTAGAAGIPVVGVTEKLSSKDRDKLYEANINPIASFPSEGLVVFGQKTLQSTRSALDRINVRRLLINVKKEISRISNGLLFDPNTQVTWDRFTGQAVPFLESVKSRLGLEDFKVVLDTTTTTPDLIDRNVMYAKIFLKPTRAIEFIAVDFVITNTGASFED
jgi:phage tail sheath protein FI